MTMRRITLLIAGVLALALAAPAVASAHYGHHHHHRHHGKHHRHKARGSDVTGAAAAAMVASFDGTTLTLTLADGSSVSGKVTDHTWIVCKASATPPAPTATASHHGGSRGDDDGGHGDCGDATPCDASDLVPGASVDGAWLRLGPDGLEFAKLDLVSASS